MRKIYLLKQGQKLPPNGDNVQGFLRTPWNATSCILLLKRLCVFDGLCVDMWRLVHQWSFLLFDCFWRLVHCWYSLVMLHVFRVTLHVFRVMLHVFSVLLHVFLVVLHVFPVMLHLFRVMLHVFLVTFIFLFLVLHFNFLFVPCGRLSWLPVSFLLNVKHTHYRIVMLHVFSVTLQETRATLQETHATLQKTRATLQETCATSQYCTNSVPAVYQSSKTVKNSETAKMTIGVYQSSHVYTESAE